MYLLCNVRLVTLRRWFRLAGWYSRPREPPFGEARRKKGAKGKPKSHLDLAATIQHAARYASHGGQAVERGVRVHSSPVLG
jgi:hypothetical protein